MNDENYEFEDVLAFLKKTEVGNAPMVLHKGVNVWMYSLIVPKYNLKRGYQDKLLYWSIDPAYYHFNRTPNGCWLSELWDDAEPAEILQGSIPVFIERDLIGDYFDVDINQVLLQSLNLHKSVGNKILTCDNDDEVGSIYDKDVTICSLSRDELNRFLKFSNSVLIRFFEFSISDGLSLSENKHFSSHVFGNIYYYLLSVEESDGSVPFKKIRGFQVIQPE